MSEASVLQAIRERKLLEFWYHGSSRVAEPHVYGVQGGERHLLTFQVGGVSRSGRLPGWRRFRLAEMSSIRVLPEQFEGPRDESQTRSASFDDIIAVVV
ncbi:MAG: WYL domain-containing protein [Phycisphaerales bacterium JB038]